jgi:hypothetical protein
MRCARAARTESLSISAGLVAATSSSSPNLSRSTFYTGLTITSTNHYHSLRSIGKLYSDSGSATFTIIRAPRIGPLKVEKTKTEETLVIDPFERIDLR